MNLDHGKLRSTLVFVAIANLAYFFVEGYFAYRAGSVSLFADSIDFLEDASVNALILVGLGWSVAARARLGRGLALLILAPGLGTLVTAVLKFRTGAVPDPEAISLVGAGAFVVNAACAFRLAFVRHHGGSLTRAAFLSARNDLLANIAIVATGFVTAGLQSPWPDLVVGLGIAVMNADAAREVWEAAVDEEGPRP